jgi:hypothetical protein
MAKRPEPYWETDYRADRRKHRHRCRACNRVIEPGQRVLMTRTKRATVAIHADHADQPIFEGEAHTWRDSFAAWGLEHLKSIGWRVPELDTCTP